MFVMLTSLSVIAQPPPVITPENAHRLTPVTRIEATLPGALSWSPDGRWLAAASSDGLTIFDAMDSYRVVYVLPDVTDEAVFGADGSSFIAEEHLYQTVSGQLLLENGVEWAEEGRHVVFVNETADTTTLYPITEGVVGEAIVTVPFPADRVVVPSVTPLLNGVFIRDDDESRGDESAFGEVTAWHWGQLITSLDTQSNLPRMVYTNIAEYDDLTVLFNPDGYIVAIMTHLSTDIITTYLGKLIPCECYQMPGFVETQRLPQYNTRVVVTPYNYSRLATHIILDVRLDDGISEWLVPSNPIPNDVQRSPSADFTESYQFGAIAADENIEIWQIDTPVPEQIAVIQGEQVYVISEDGKRVLTRSGDELLIWSLDEISMPKAVRIESNLTTADRTFAPDNPSALFFSHWENGYEVWNEQPDGTWIKASSSTEGGYYTFVAKGRFVVRTTVDGALVALFNSTTAEALVEKPAAFAVSSDSEQLAFWEDDVLRVVETATLLSRDILTIRSPVSEASILNLPLDEAYISNLSISQFNDDRTLSVSRRDLTDEEQQALPDPRFERDVVEIRDVKTGEIRHSIQTSYQSNSVFVPDTDLLLIQGRIYIEIWDIAAQPAVRQGYFKLDVDSFPLIYMTSVEFNEARTQALVWIRTDGPGLGYGSVVLIPLNVQTDEAILVDSLWVGKDDVVNSPRFSANETYALMSVSTSTFASPDETAVYRFSDGASVLLPGQLGAMSPDETLLVTASPLRIWNVADPFTESNPQPLAEYSETDVISIAFSPDGTQLYTWNEAGVTIWQVDR